MTRRHPKQSDIGFPQVGRVSHNGFLSKSLPRGMRMPHGLTDWKDKNGRTFVKSNYDARELAKRLETEHESITYMPEDDD